MQKTSLLQISQIKSQKEARKESIYRSRNWPSQKPMVRGRQRLFHKWRITDCPFVALFCCHNPGKLNLDLNDFSRTRPLAKVPKGDDQETCGISKFVQIQVQCPDYGQQTATKGQSVILHL